MSRLFICLGILWACPAAVAQDEYESLSFQFEAREVALSFSQGRIQWHIQALDLLQLPVVEPFDGIVLDDETLLTQELLEPGVEFDDEQRFFVTFSVRW